jgi:hypothetical protein
MAKLTPNIPYEDLGDCHQIAEFSAALVMESSEFVSYLALSDIRPEQCGSTVVRRASFGDIEALAGELSVVPRWVIDRSGARGFVEGDGGSEGFGVRSVAVEGKSLPRLLLRRQ